MNTNAKHTPGPWTAASQDAETNEIPIKSGKSILARVAPRPHWDATQESNARLIAAAPALLIELKNTVAAIEKWGKEHPESGGWIGVIHGALKAIAQAEGGAQ